ncbi:hypothetical protein B0H15DRAFT_950600 [Mycena belliarum]|uniref:Uncharacterized protein n=1 Tax=Mycena belliarum TaxID=1033014 RepID=A0AAD6U667_9AGAR|nr:hypothetical protein B0H15DRAFT_950600 [Mycena belliae]
MPAAGQIAPRDTSCAAAEQGRRLVTREHAAYTITTAKAWHQDSARKFRGGDRPVHVPCRSKPPALEPRVATQRLPVPTSTNAMVGGEIAPQSSAPPSRFFDAACAVPAQREDVESSTMCIRSQAASLQGVASDSAAEYTKDRGTCGPRIRAREHSEHTWSVYASPASFPVGQDSTVDKEMSQRSSAASGPYALAESYVGLRLCEASSRPSDGVGVLSATQIRTATAIEFRTPQDIWPTEIRSEQEWRSESARTFEEPAHAAPALAASPRTLPARLQVPPSPPLKSPAPAPAIADAVELGGLRIEVRQPRVTACASRIERGGLAYVPLRIEGAASGGYAWEAGGAHLAHSRLAAESSPHRLSETESSVGRLSEIPQERMPRQHTGFPDLEEAHTLEEDTSTSSERYAPLQTSLPASSLHPPAAPAPVLDQGLVGEPSDTAHAANQHRMVEFEMPKLAWRTSKVLGFALVSAILWARWIPHLVHNAHGELAPELAWEREGIGTRCWT